MFSLVQTFGEGLPQPPSLVAPPLDTETREFVASKLRVDAATVEFRSGFSEGSTRRGYVRQRHVRSIHPFALIFLGH